MDGTCIIMGYYLYARFIHLGSVVHSAGDHFKIYATYALFCIQHKQYRRNTYTTKLTPISTQYMQRDSSIHDISKLQER